MTCVKFITSLDPSPVQFGKPCKKWKQEIKFIQNQFFITYKSNKDLANLLRKHDYNYILKMRLGKLTIIE